MSMHKMKMPVHTFKVFLLISEMLMGKNNMASTIKNIGLMKKKAEYSVSLKHLIKNQQLRSIKKLMAFSLMKYLRLVGVLENISLELQLYLK